jgi:hypothetical protein
MPNYIIAALITAFFFTGALVGILVGFMLGIRSKQPWHRTYKK